MLIKDFENSDCLFKLLIRTDAYLKGLFYQFKLSLIILLLLFKLFLKMAIDNPRGTLLS